MCRIFTFLKVSLWKFGFSAVLSLKAQKSEFFTNVYNVNKKEIYMVLMKVCICRCSSNKPFNEQSLKNLDMFLHFP